MKPADIIAVHRANAKANENRSREAAKPFLAEMKAQIDELTKQNAELHEGIHNLEAENAARVEEIETYKAQIAELEQKLAAATAKKGAKK